MIRFKFKQKNFNLLVQKRYKSTFQHSNSGTFFQNEPVLANVYTQDKFLYRYLKRHMPSKYFVNVNNDLQKFGDRLVEEIHIKGIDCEKNPPHLQQFDAWGNRIDKVITCQAWKSMKSVSAEEGVIAIGYAREQEEYSRLYQFAKMYLFAPNSGLYSCPLAMVDGAAAVLENLKPEYDFAKETLKRLTSTDPNQFWTSGQWMTERKGGSDVAGGTETIAYLQNDGTYRLNGYKWFTSATDADVALTLARIADKNGETQSGTKGLSIFLLPIRDIKSSMPSGLNGLQVQRLKEKLGTRQLPTSEMLLDGTVAYLLGERGNGVKNISTMLTLTRIHNAIASVANMRQILHLAVDYSKKRKAFGSTISEFPLHVKTLADMDIRSRASFMLTFDVTLLLGKVETGKATEIDKLLLRLLTPIAKLYTAKEAIAIASEGLECFGGQGYLEDTGLPTYLRDAQVLSIWEGTTNVLSLDVLRAVLKSKGAVLNAYFKTVEQKIHCIKEFKRNNKLLDSSINKVCKAVDDINQFTSKISTTSSMDYFARDLSYSLARTYAAVLLLEHAVGAEAEQSDITTAIAWCKSDLCIVSININGIKTEAELFKNLVYSV